MDSRPDFDNLYARHAPAVVRAANAVLRDVTLAEDVAQEVFIRLWRGCGYDPRRGELGAYLRMLARSRALDLVRKHRAEERMSLQLQARTASASVADEALAPVLRAADREQTRTAVARLPADQRHAIGLVYWAGLTTQEAADLQGIPLGTAKSRVRLALHKLAQDPAMAGP
jgi:RNA polymerase sigma-70 factor (ECF subfamily)